jgi:hypothetical protein
LCVCTCWSLKPSYLSFIANMACRSLFVSIALESTCLSFCFSLQLGFDSLFFARIDYQDRAKRLKEKNLEVVWQGSKSLGSTSQVGILNLYISFAFYNFYIRIVICYHLLITASFIEV